MSTVPPGRIQPLSELLTPEFLAAMPSRLRREADNALRLEQELARRKQLAGDAMVDNLALIETGRAGPFKLYARLHHAFVVRGALKRGYETERHYRVARANLEKRAAWYDRIEAAKAAGRRKAETPENFARRAVSQAVRDVMPLVAETSARAAAAAAVEALRRFEQPEPLDLGEQPVRPTHDPEARERARKSLLADAQKRAAAARRLFGEREGNRAAGALADKIDRELNARYGGSARPPRQRDD